MKSLNKCTVKRNLTQKWSFAKTHKFAMYIWYAHACPEPKKPSDLDFVADRWVYQGVEPNSSHNFWAGLKLSTTDTSAMFHCFEIKSLNKKELQEVCAGFIRPFLSSWKKEQYRHSIQHFTSVSIRPNSNSFVLSQQSRIRNRQPHPPPLKWNTCQYIFM